MSETIEVVGESVEKGENYNPPTLEELEQHMTELEERGVPVELECFERGNSVDHRVLPEERDLDKPLGKMLCRSCMVEHPQARNLF
ncbi:hypothetical protein C477_02799 [Haloterrigena salina JCM 13891]|uniref:Uncharacterized protein n=1 Tax=Haloterrigena salina JCM 13891 TaxID=1227488 RepID=M0CNJ9_9EURY|nr:hypothetical protein [Haloterrigena salina]ELZ23439.1 hypothetical protein C477_02799 [Haloterrigena salina JCM 13891]